MKKIITLLAMSLAIFTIAFSQTFTGSGMKPGQSDTSPNRSVTSTYVLTQSVSQTIISGNSVSCNAGGLHTNNSYMRVFDLYGSYSISGAINITGVDFGIELASAGTGGSQPVTVNIYTLTGALLFSNLTLVGTQTVNIPDQSLTIFNVPVSALIPAGSLMVVEVFTPIGQFNGNSFFIGSNSLGQTAPTYLAAADCGVPQPTATSTLGFPGMHVVMNVYADPVDNVPINSWAVIIGLVLMGSFIIYRIKR